MPSKVIAGVVAVVGFAIMVGCAVPLSQELKKAAKDQSASRKNGLIAGVVIGALMLVAGIAMFFMGGGGSSNASKQTAAAAAVIAQNPLNIATNAANQAEIKATVNAQAAENLVNKTKGLKEDLAKLKGVFASLKPT